MIRQHGFAAQGILILVVAVALVVGGGYFVLSRQNKDAEPQIVQSADTATTIANGTPENAVNAVNQQLTDEIANEVNALDTEDKDSEIDATAIEELEGAIDESSL